MSDKFELDEQALEQVNGGCAGQNGYTHCDRVTQSTLDAG